MSEKDDGFRRMAEIGYIIDLMGDPETPKTSYHTEWLQSGGCGKIGSDSFNRLKNKRLQLDH
jgi:hypothetical protein